MDTRDWEKHASLIVAKNGVATLAIRDAGSLNILSTPVITALVRAIADVGRRSDIKVMVLRGQGEKAFVAGADIKEMAGLTQSSAMTFIENLRQLCDGVRLLSIPVIARVPGWCLGGGMELALACDIRIASANAKMGMPEVKVGIPSVIHAALLPRLVGRARASWLLMTGEIVDATEAQTYGLLDRVVAPDDLDKEVARVADMMASYGSQALAQQKRLLRQWEDEPLDKSIQSSVAEFGSAFNTGEPQKYMSEFARNKK